MRASNAAAQSGGLAAGVDLGGTKIAIVMVDADGQVVRERRRYTDPDQGPRGVVEDLLGALGDSIAEAPAAVDTVGVGVAGQVNPENGAVRYAPNLRWRDFPLQARLEEALALPVEVLNDVQAACYGEWTYGAGEGASDLVALFVGTGVGGGIISGGRLQRGCSGNAGELGHLIIDLHGPPCTCGKHGCLEAFAGGWAIARRAQERVATDVAAGAHLLELADGDPEAISARTLARALEDDDPLARELLEEVIDALGAGAATVANAFNPCVLVLGGGVVEGLPQLVDGVATRIRERALQAAVDPIQVVKARLGEHAGAVGAAAWARERRA